MPRIQSYVPAGNYKKMEEIIDVLQKDGATRSEANISSIAAKLIDMGLILWEAQNNNVMTDDADVEGSDEEQDAEESLKKIHKGVYRTELFAQTVLQLLIDPSQIDKGIDYNALKQQIHKNAELNVK